MVGKPGLSTTSYAVAVVPGEKVPVGELCPKMHASAIITIASENLTDVSCPGRCAGLGAVSCRQDYMLFLEEVAFPSSDPN